MKAPFRRVLLALYDPVILGAGRRALEEAGYEVTGLTDSGLDALRMIHALEPDAVLMSRYLKEKDAFYVLEELNRTPLGSMPAVAVAVSDDRKDELNRIEELGAYAALPEPVLPADLVEALRAAQPMSRMIPCFAKEETIRSVLDGMAIDRKLKGYEYLVTAIGIACRSHTFYRAMTTVIYPETARLFSVNKGQVERDIRHAIESAWMKGDLDRQYDYFGNTIDGNRAKPTNSEFIARITEALRLEVM